LRELFEHKQTGDSFRAFLNPPTIAGNRRAGQGDQFGEILSVVIGLARQKTEFTHEGFSVENGSGLNCALVDADQKQKNRKNQKKVEHEFRDSRKYSNDTGKAEHRRDDGNDKKAQCIVRHLALLSAFD
jgi:hypothetical protein